jgi:hypothetical protein
MNKFSIFKALSISFVLILGITSCSSSSEDEETTDSTTTQYDITSILDKFKGTGLTVAVNGNTVTFTTQNLPNHKSPYWPTNNALYEAYNGTNTAFNLNPNSISSQNITFSIPLNPSEASNKQATNLGPIGVSVNGVVFLQSVCWAKQSSVNKRN